MPSNGVSRTQWLQIWSTSLVGLSAIAMEIIFRPLVDPLFVHPAQYFLDLGLGRTISGMIGISIYFLSLLAGFLLLSYLPQKALIRSFQRRNQTRVV